MLAGSAGLHSVSPPDIVPTLNAALTVTVCGVVENAAVPQVGVT